MAMRERVKLGELLLNAGLITTTQLNEAVARQRKTRERLGEALVNLGAVSEENLAKTLAGQLKLPYATMGNGLLTPAKAGALAQIVPEETARKYHVLPLSLARGFLTIATTDPFDLLLLDNLRKLTGQELTLVVATRSELEKALNAFYGTKDYFQQAVQESYQSAADVTLETVEEEQAGETPVSLDDLVAKAGEATVVKLVDLLIREAINVRASDIHVEPYPKQISIRYRIDGLLHKVEPPAASLFPAIVSRLKIMAKLNIAEKRLPQDGGFSVRIAGRTVDIRMSTIPTIYGEKVVLRLLDKSQVLLDFDALGFSGKTLEHLERAIQAPYGLIFITGPTGSGKTTTLYTALSKINAPAKNILTIEDPVEYKLPGIIQMQAKPEIGVTFAAGLRAFLRQDPDVMMVGEVRDLETAEICVRAALTGHLVLSTLHTNDAASTINRLLDLGVEPFLLAPSLVMVIAQRLMRRLCKECKEAYELPDTLRAQIPEAAAYHTFYRAQGCDFCRQSGYAGRLAIFEGLYVTEAIQELISQRAPLGQLREAMGRSGMLTLREDGVQKAAAGLTSLEEIMGSTMIRGE